MCICESIGMGWNILKDFLGYFQKTLQFSSQLFDDISPRIIEAIIMIFFKNHQSYYCGFLKQYSSKDYQDHNRGFLRNIFQGLSRPKILNCTHILKYHIMMHCLKNICISKIIQATNVDIKKNIYLYFKDLPSYERGFSRET